MLLQKYKISELIPAPWNPRQISPEALKGLTASIDRFGLVEPIVLNKRTGHVVGGHQRLKVLQDRGETETDCVVVDLPETEEKALNVALNNPHIAGEFTPELQMVLEEIRMELPDEFDALRLDLITIEGFTDAPEMHWINQQENPEGIPDKKQMTFFLSPPDFEIIRKHLHGFCDNPSEALVLWYENSK